MKIGDEVYVHGYIDEIRKDVVIIKNDGGYFGTVPSEITAFEQEPILDKIRADIIKLADTISFISGDIKAKYTNIGQHDGLEQALEIIEGNIKGDFDIDEWMAENE